jgi:polyphosphate kinase 2 (PPK2 family)
MPENGVTSRMKRKAYERELGKLQVGLCQLQQWVKEKKLRAIILFSPSGRFRAKTSDCRNDRTKVVTMTKPACAD